MKRTIRSSAWAMTLLALSIAAAGCNDSPKWKNDVTAALTKQAEVKQYAFTGEADLNVGLPAPAADSNAATAVLVSMFSTGKIAWSGLSSTDPLRMEAEYKLTPGGSSASFTLPVIFKDNLIYMSIPLLNKPGEYFSFNLAGSGGAAESQAASDAGSLKNVNQAMSDSVKQLVGDFDPKWFKKDKKTAQLKDGGEATVIRVPVTEKNKDAVTEKLQAKLPAVLDGWKASGILTAAQAGGLKAGVAGSWRVTGGELAFTLDQAGFVRQETVNIDYRTAAEADRHVHYTQSYDGINQPPAFKKDTPKSVRPFAEVLQLLQTQKGGK